MMLQLLSKHIIYPLWEIKDRSIRLKEYRSLLHSQWLSLEERENLQLEKLNLLIQDAVKNVPYYREKLGSFISESKDLESLGELKQLPILEKSDVRQNLDQLISQKYNKQDLVKAKTGGSTGVSLDLYFSEEAQQIRNAAQWRSDYWAGWDLGFYQASIWGNPPHFDTFKKKIRNTFLDRHFFLDTMNLTDESMAFFLKELKKKKPAVIFGHAHSIYIFACFCDKQSVTVEVNGIIATSMMLLDHERQLIEKVFGIKVQNRYGCEEVSLIASEVPETGEMLLNTDHVIVEYLKEDGTDAKPGEEGDIVVTDLINDAMPLIRYRVGDVGVPSNKVALCGRGMPVMAKLMGRVADFLVNKERGKVAGISLIERTLTKIPGIYQMQLVQNDLQSLDVNLVKGSEFDPCTEKALLEEFQLVFGDIEYRLHYCDEIKQEANGKFRFSKCHVEV